MMMVNHLNNNPVPWQSTIPDQMPWLSSSSSAACPTGEPMQFIGQPPCGQNLITPTTIEQPNHIDVMSMPSTLTTTTTATTFHQQIPPIPINPFDPQIANYTSSSTIGQLYNNNNLLRPSSNGLTSSISSATMPAHMIGPHAQIVGSLTPMPQPPPHFIGQPSHVPVNICDQPMQHKRSSIEMEDDLTTQEAPPTKQQLSENILFDRFGSLQLDGDKGRVGLASVETSDSDLDTSDDIDQSKPNSTTSDARKEFNRYVYLLFKDKNSDNPFSAATNGAVERLIREEREKLSKAVILWTPPREPNTFDGSDDDEDLKYTDHRDFLKRPTNSSVIITEVDEDVPIKDIEHIEPDDIMFE